jgi:uncharacterized membrane protein YeaQ/YmgE (transglycosylase-associated protein family)
MTLEMIAMWVLAGAVAGFLAGFLMKRGGRGLMGDIPLGLVGSLAGSWIFWVLGLSAEAGLVAVAVVAFAGAAILIAVQRRFWPALG